MKDQPYGNEAELSDNLALQSHPSIIQGRNFFIQDNNTKEKAN